MSEDWSPWIIGSKSKPGKKLRSQISFCCSTVSQDLIFLANDPEYRKGVGNHSYKKRKQTAGRGKSARFVLLQGIVAHEE